MWNKTDWLTDWLTDGPTNQPTDWLTYLGKTRARIIDPRTSLEFANCASEICPNINIIHYPTEIIENVKPILENYVVAVQTITTDSSDYKEFPFLTRNLLQVKPYKLLIFSTFMILITTKESGWKFYMEMNLKLDLFLTSIHLINLSVLSVWVFFRVSTGSLSLKGIQFGIAGLMCLGDQIMIQQWTNIACTWLVQIINIWIMHIINM